MKPRSSTLLIYSASTLYCQLKLPSLNALPNCSTLQVTPYFYCRLGKKLTGVCRVPASALGACAPFSPSESLQPGVNCSHCIECRHDGALHKPYGPVHSSIEEFPNIPVRSHLIELSWPLLMNLFRPMDSDWLLTDSSITWSGSTADRAWRFLRQSLERHDGAETDHRYTKACLETIISLDRSSPPPPWLLQIIQVSVSLSMAL